jgi:hypothetical protein
LTVEQLDETASLGDQDPAVGEEVEVGRRGKVGSDDVR